MEAVNYNFRSTDPKYAPNEAYATEFRREVSHPYSKDPPVHFMGLLDTVGALGVPLVVWDVFAEPCHPSGFRCPHGPPSTWVTEGLSIARALQVCAACPWQRQFFTRYLGNPLFPHERRRGCGPKAGEQTLSELLACDLVQCVIQILLDCGKQWGDLGNLPSTRMCGVSPLTLALRARRRFGKVHPSSCKCSRKSSAQDSYHTAHCVGLAQRQTLTLACHSQWDDDLGRFRSTV